jgi:hypothetical protein
MGVRKDGSLVVTDPERGQLALRPDYVAREVETHLSAQIAQ